MSRDDDLEALATVVIDMGLRLHQDLGPGLLESAYEMILFEKLHQRGIEVGPAFERRTSLFLCGFV